MTGFEYMKNESRKLRVKRFCRWLEKQKKNHCPSNFGLENNCNVMFDCNWCWNKTLRSEVRKP